ncbi:MAG: AI-2E family transporter, partial [Oscillospiraceae bacterium]|nr:AI-2E family transporter [Oscillospiraceae bacterium]
VGTTLMNTPYAMLVSVIVGVTNVIPYFGPFIGAIPSILLFLLVDPVQALYFSIFILILQQCDGNIIGPKILGDSTGLSAFWVVFSVTFFGGLFGFVGMLIGIPTFAVIYSLIRRLAAYCLRKKNLPTDTDSYAAPTHALPIKNSQTQQKGQD